MHAEENNTIRNMTRKKSSPYREKGRALFLTVIMVLSVVAMTASLAGPVAATNHPVDGDYVTFGPTQTAADELQVTFNESVPQLDDENVTVWTWDGDEIEVNPGDVELFANDYAANITLDEDLVGHEAYLEIDGDNVSIESSSTQQEIDSGNVLDVIEPFAGEHVAILTSTGDTITIDHPDGERDRGVGANSTVRVIDTGEWEAGDTINVTSDARDGEVSIELRSLEYDVEMDEDEFDDDEDITGEVESDRVERDIILRLLEDGDEDEIADEKTATTDTEGEYEFSFDPADEGNYTVQVIDEVTWIDGESDEFSVAEVPDPEGEAWFDDVENVAEGDVMEIPLEFEDSEDLDNVSVLIDEDDYEANITLEFDGFEDDEVTLFWDTYRAGNATGERTGFGVNGSPVFATDDGANVTPVLNDETNISSDFRLNPAGYTFSLYEDGNFDTRVDSASAAVEERSTGSADTGTAPIEPAPNGTSTIADADDFFDKIVENTTGTDTIAEEDWLVIAQEVSGLGADFDQLERADGLNATLSDDNLNGWGEGTFSDEAGLEVLFEALDEPAYADPEDFNESEGYWSYNASSGYLLLAVQADEDDELEEDDVIEWEYSFTVTEDNAYIDDEDDEEEASAQYEVTWRSVWLDVVEEPYQVTPDENATFAGDSTIAPGSEIELEIDMPGVFLDVEDVNISEDRTWEHVGNYSDREVGDEIEITVNWYDDSETYDGIFSDTAEADTATGEQQMRNLLDQIKELLDVEEDDEIVPALEEALEAEDPELQEELEELQAELAMLQGELAQAEERAEGAEAQIEFLEEEIQTLEEQNEQLEQDNEELQAFYDEANAILDAFDIADLDELTAALEELEELRVFEENVQNIMDAHDIDDLEELNERLAEAQPGFGVIFGLLAILAGGAMVARRRLDN